MNESPIKVSVIVPVYNAENYLEQCLESILRQTYKNFELIIVDDGSTDRSGDICEKYIKQFRHGKLLHKKNKGLISARIDGLYKSVGRYISFIDADDCVDREFLEFLATNMETKQADIVITGCIKEEEKLSEKIGNLCGNGIYERADLVEQIFPKALYFQGFFEFGILPYMCNKMFKKEKLLECYDGIDTDIYDGEDVAVVFPYLLHADRAVICDEAMYHYRIHNTSMTAGKKPDYYANVAKLYLHLYGKFLKSAFSDVFLNQLDQFMRMMVWNGNPKGFIEADKSVFPFEHVPKGASIVLYAAGNVGRRYYAQIRKTGYCHLTAWVDQNWRMEELQQMGVESPDVINERKFDYVVIAVEKQEIAVQVRSDLIHRGIEKTKIILSQKLL